LNSNPLKTLTDLGCPSNIIEHSKAVSRKALIIGSNFMDNNESYVDLKLVETGAMLHDIGRIKTHSIKHAVIGSEMLRKLNFPDEIVNITLKHIGAGIPSDEAEILELPPGDYMPCTLEEKIVAHADNLICGIIEVNIDFVLKKWEKKFGKNHPSIYRLKKLDEELMEIY
jgi:uncharacterized protein